MPMALVHQTSHFKVVSIVQVSFNLFDYFKSVSVTYVTAAGLRASNSRNTSVGRS